MPVSYCLVGTGDTISGSLKITNGGKAKQYSPQEILQAFNDRDVTLSLRKPFAVEAQATSDSAFVLKVEITADGQTMFNDETSAFGTISASSDDLYTR